MICRTHSWTNASEHDNLYFVVSNERVSEYHSEFALPERNVLTLRGLTTLLIECTYAFLQTKKRLINFCTLSLSVFIVTLTILSSLTTCQVNKKKFTTVIDSLFLNFDLGDSMTSAGSIICFGCVSCPHLVSLLDEIEDLIIIVNELFFESSNLNCV